jgi:large subunit ribosomal protein L3
MTIGLVGRKCGMTRVFTDAGETVPVTVIEALPNRITQVKGADSDGYRALQVTIGARRQSLLNKPVAGHYAKANVAPGRLLWEFRLTGNEGADLKAGAELKVDQFQVGQIVDVTGTTIGKGFAGVMKRHNFAGGYASHGASLSHRVPGSIGQRQTPGRVFPGKRMSGHMGVRRRTIENLKVVQVDAERNLLLISGAVPGAEGGDVIVRPSVKAAARARKPKAAATKTAAKK